MYADEDGVVDGSEAEGGERAGESAGGGLTSVS